MPKQKARKRRRSSKKKRKKRAARPLKLDAVSRARRRHKKRRHPASAPRGHHKRMHKEAELMNYLLHQVLKTAASTDADPYHYEPRHYSKDPEYKFSTARMREFKRGVPAPDTTHLRPQGAGMPPHRGNFPYWEPEWEHTYDQHHPHAAFPWY